MKIRQASTEDIDAICLLADEINRLHFMNLPNIFTDPDNSEGNHAFWLKVLEADNSAFYVAEDSGKVIGFVTAKITQNSEISFINNNKICRIGTIVVKEGQQGKGIGRLLMSSVENWALKCEAVDIRLEVMAFNEKAMDFYAGSGFVTHSKTLVKSVN